jgi:hydrogenase nickel incorporation protein HypB
MCGTCGCSDHVPDHDHHHEHAHGGHADGRGQHSHDSAHHGHAGHSHEGAPSTLLIEQSILAKNARLAAQNRASFAEKRLFAVNLMSSPGSGKTTLLERTIRELPGRSISVIEGDQATSHDAERIRRAGARAVQINTGPGCHLDAHLVLHALERLEPPEGGLVMIENVGNLVCPALFDLGESARVVICSVTEGDDKPLKYPHMFKACDLLILNKIDLLPYVEFDVERAIENARRVNPRVSVIPLSATRGDGVPSWLDWLEVRRARAEERG